MAKRNLVREGRRFLTHVVPAVLKPLRTLWNEVIGFLFLVFAGLGLLHALREYHKLDSDQGSLFRIIVALVFAGIMGLYGVSSFRRARKISRS